MVQEIRMANRGRTNKPAAKLAKLAPLLKNNKIKKGNYLVKPSCWAKNESYRSNCLIRDVENQVIIKNSLNLGLSYLRNH